jgi:Zn-dependent protease with chaperone function
MSDHIFTEKRLGDTAKVIPGYPFKSDTFGKEGFAAELFGSHPPMAKRIMALEAMAYQAKTTG